MLTAESRKQNKRFEFSFFSKIYQKSRLENNCGGEKESWEELILEENAVQGVVHQIDLVNELGTVDQGRNRLEI